MTKYTLPADKAQSKFYIGIASGGTKRFGVMMKNAGYDQIIITGRSEKPVYLYIENDQVEIRQADDLWGWKNVFET